MEECGIYVYRHRPIRHHDSLLPTKQRMGYQYDANDKPVGICRWLRPDHLHSAYRGLSHVHVIAFGRNYHNEKKYSCPPRFQRKKKTPYKTHGRITNGTNAGLFGQLN